MDDREFRDRLIADVSSWIAEKTGANPAEIAGALVECLESKAMSPLLVRLLRVDWVVRGTPDKATLDEYILLRDGDRFVRGRVSSSISWTDLPREVRSFYIHNRPAEQAFVLFEGSSHTRGDVGLGGGN